MKKTKIVCTIGPACASKEMLEKLITAGLDVARLNFSHGSHEDHGQVITAIRELSSRCGKHVAILQDLCGPKIRLGEIENAPVTLKKDDIFTIVAHEIKGDSRKATVTYKNLSNEAHAGDRILIDDGLIELKVKEIVGEEIRCLVITGGPISPHKGVNLPGIKLTIPALTEKDEDDLRFGLASGVDMVALSFVRYESDILRAREIMKEEGRFVPIIAKIEKQEAVDNFESILHLADGIMVARGDLGVELPYEEVPLIQKRLIRLCRQSAKPVITATQMLDSMIRNPRPTRAEATDVANAIMDGTDAIMLSGETASGSYPVAAVEAMARIAAFTEEHMVCEENFPGQCDKRNAVEAISMATCEMAEQMQARAIIVSTGSGRTARAVSKYKPRHPVIAVSDSLDTCKRLMLSWGVFPVHLEPSKNIKTFIEEICSASLGTGIVAEGDLVILTAGIPEGMKGSTNMIKLHILGHQFTRGIGVGSLRSVTGKVCTALNPQEIEKKLGKGDILVMSRIDESMETLLYNAGGVITEEGDMHSPAARVLAKISTPGILGVPKALELFRDGDIVNMDAQRGLIFEAH